MFQQKITHLKLVSKLCKNLKNFFVTFDTPCLMHVCESYYKWKTKKCCWFIIFGKDIFSSKKKQFNFSNSNDTNL